MDRPAVGHSDRGDRTASHASEAGQQGLEHVWVVDASAQVDPMAVAEDGQAGVVRLGGTGQQHHEQAENRSR
ncbi:MAG: hypothetical protein ACRD0K_28130 [Egibacteraceae bacterium]